MKVANLGCKASDYEGINASQIAIILRGNCTFFEKANLSYAAGFFSSFY
jgi:hypothetical protein